MGGVYGLNSNFFLEAISKILDAVSLRPSKARLDSGFGFENLSLTRGEVFLRWLLLVKLL
jgi:hypothetical protein